jgi:hypothetical protein
MRARALNSSSARCWADPAPAEGDAARVPAALLHQLRERLGRLRGRTHQHHGGLPHHRDRREIALGVVAQLGVQPRRDAVAVDVRHQQRVAVARLLGHEVGRDDAGRARLVVDDDGDVPQHLQLLPQDARQHVGAPAGRKADDQLHRPAGQIGLRSSPRGRGQCRAGG